MTREQIEKAAKDYVMPNARIRPLMESIAAKEGFIAGAQWRINSVWHDATNIPKKGEYIVIVFRSGNFASWNVSYNIVDVFKKFDIILWSYSKDLLPERKEVTNGGR